MKLLVIPFFLFFSSCSLVPFFSEDSLDKSILSTYQYLTPQDYIDHLNSLGPTYLENPYIQIINLTKSDQSYLLDLMERLTKNNELLFSDKQSAKVHIIKHASPFHFSLPNRQIFLSLGLINKYIKHEGILSSILAFELVKSDKNIYAPNIIIPTGYVSTERLISLTRIPLRDKLEVDKWAFYSLRRAGFDAYSYLTWIQIQNKNAVDFALHLGDIKKISREETLFKSFFIKRGLAKGTSYNLEANSSKNFYTFIYRMKKINL